MNYGLRCYGTFRFTGRDAQGKMMFRGESPYLGPWTFHVTDEWFW